MSADRPQKADRNNLTAERWAEAALDAMAQGGLNAVAVEPIARQLGVTKGSFYWHFTNRGSLVAAALALWERQETDEILKRVEHVSDPYERIVELFKQANASYRAGRLYLALAASAHKPEVRAAVERVSTRRMDYLHQCYVALGMNEVEAGHWSRFAYATFVGNIQIKRDTPQAMPSGQAFSDYLKLMIKTLIPKKAKTVRSREEAPRDTAEVLPIRKTGSD